MIVKGYVMHLYCKNKYEETDTPCNDKWSYHWGAEFGADTLAGARRNAKYHGWKFVNGDVICPMCANNVKESL